MDRKIFILFGLLISFQAVDIFFANDLTLENFINFGEKIFPAFETVDFNGEIVTEKIFENKISVLILWTTKDEKSCELLKKIAAEIKNLPENVQIIGLVGDVRDNDTEIFQNAKKISQKNFPAIRQLAVNDNFYPVLSKIRTVPTTILVDEKGNLIGQPAGGGLEFILSELNFILEKNSPRSQSLIKIQDFILNKN